MLWLTACDGGGGSSSESALPATASSNAFLSDLTLYDAVLDQTFQSRQLSYTASVNFLIRSTTVTPATADANATVTVNGTTVSSGNDSEPITLSEGLNTITVVVTAEDEITINTYTFEVTVETAEDFAQQAFIKAEDAEAGDRFGSPIALSDDTLAVAKHGAVHVFSRDNGIWGHEAILKVSIAEGDLGDTPPVGDWDFVHSISDDSVSSIALLGDTLAVGAPGESSSATGGEADNSAPDAGAVYIYTRSNGIWEQEAFLKASNAEGRWEEREVYEESIGIFAVGDNFGSSVALSEDTVVIGAPGEDSSIAGGENDNSAENAGAVYVFNRIDGVWNQETILKSADAAAGHAMGRLIALSENTLAVQGNSGVYFFAYTDKSWKQEAFLGDIAPYSPAGREQASIALAGDTLAVGKFRLEEGDDFGAVHVYTRSGAAWSQQAHLKASNADGTSVKEACSLPASSNDYQFGDQFGSSVALSGDTLVVGARLESSSATGGEADNSALFAGAVYVFRRTNEIWSQVVFLKASNADGYCTPGMVEFHGDAFGSSVAIWRGSIAVGAPAEDSSAIGGETDNSEENSGAAYVFE